MKAGVQEGDRIVKVSCVSKGCPSCWSSAAPVSTHVGQLAVCWEEGTLPPPGFSAEPVLPLALPGR